MDIDRVIYLYVGTHLSLWMELCTLYHYQHKRWIYYNHRVCFLSHGVLISSQIDKQVAFAFGLASISTHNSMAKDRDLWLLSNLKGHVTTEQLVHLFCWSFFFFFFFLFMWLTLKDIVTSYSEHHFYRLTHQFPPKPLCILKIAQLLFNLDSLSSLSNSNIEIYDNQR